MKLTIRNVSTLVQTDDHHETQWLGDLLSVPVEKAYFMRRNPKFSNWDGKKRFFTKEKFPTGLVPLVYQQAREDRIPIELKDERLNDPLAYQIAHDRPLQYLKTPWQWWDIMQRSGVTKKVQILKCLYQYHAARKFLNNHFLGMPWPRGVLEMCTASGKTSTAAMIIRAVGMPTLYLVNTLVLLNQTVKALERLMPRARLPIGKFGEGFRDFQDITVGTVQTAFSLLKDERSKREFLKYLQSVSLLVVDEAHHISGKQASSWDMLMRAIPAYWRVAFTGTALKRRDPGDVALIGYAGEVLYQLRSKELIDKGLLADINVTMYEVKQPDCRGLNFQAAYKQSVVDNSWLHELVVEMVRGYVSQDMPVLILTRQKQHGRQLVDLLTLLRSSMLTVEYLDGEAPVKERMAAMDRIDSGDLDCIVSTTIFDEGVDMPNIRVLILLSGGASEIKSLQRVGRGLRYKAGENKLDVIDFYYRNNKHLEKHSHEHLRVFKEEGWPTKVVQVD